MHQNYGRERLEMTHQIRTLKQELRVERHRNEELHRSIKDTNTVPEPAPELSSSDSCDTQAEVTNVELQPEQGEQARTLRYRRMGKAALVNPLVVDTSRCTLPVAESVEIGCGSDQRKRAKRSRRKEMPAEPPCNTNA